MGDQMATQLIEIQEGILIEVEVPEDSLRHIAGGGVQHVQHVNSSISAIEPLLLKACQPVKNVFKELNKDMTVSEVSVELKLGFEAEGNFFIASGKTNASMTVKLTLKPKS